MSQPRSSSIPPSAALRASSEGLSHTRRFAIITGGFLLVAAARIVLEPLLAGRQPFSLFLPAVLLAAWYGGVIPAILISLLGGAIGNYLMSGTYSWDRHGLDNFLGMGLYGISAAIIIALAEASRRSARATADAAAAQSTEGERLRVTLEGIGDAVIATDARGLVTLMNPVAEALTGWKQEEAAGREAPEIFHIVNEETRAEAEGPISRVLRENVVVGLANHTILIARDGREIAIDDSGAPIRGADGSLLGVVLVFRDVSERREKERALERHSQLLELARDPVLVHDLNNRIIFWNRASEASYGWSESEAVGRIAYELLLTRFPDSFSAVQRALTSSGFWEGELIHTCKDGRQVTMASRWALQRDDNGEPLAILEINHDITAERRATEALRLSEERLAVTLASIGDAVIATDSAGHITFINDMAAKLTGWSTSEAAGRPAGEVFRILNEQTREPAESPVDQALAEGEIVALANHTILLARDCREIAIDDSAAPIYDAAGNTLGVVLVFRDVTERRRMEAAIRDRAAEIETLMDVAPVAIWFAHDRECRRITGNRRGMEILRSSPDQNLSQTAPPNEVPTFSVYRDGKPIPNEELPMQYSAAHGVDVRDSELEIVFPDGTVTYAYGNASPLFDANGEVRGSIGTFLDMTERRQTEAALRQSEEQQRATLESIGDGFFACDSDWRFVYVNAPAERILGIRREEVLGRSHWDVFPRTLGTRLEHEYRRAAGGEMRDFENYYEPWDRWFHNRCFPRRGGGMSVYFQDITARKAADKEQEQHLHEIENLNERLRRAMAETHHRVKNNLQVISALIDLQLMKDLESVPTSELARMGHHIRSLAAIHDVLTKEARSNGDVEFLSTQSALSKLEPLVADMVGGRPLCFDVEDIRLPIRQGTSLAVLVNELISNAAKHGQGRINLRLAVVGKRARLEVTDEGLGFPADFDAHRSANTGLELVENVSRWDLQGDVIYCNGLDGGARVIVEFPLSDVAAGDPSPAE